MVEILNKKYFLFNLLYIFLAVTGCSTGNHKEETTGSSARNKQYIVVKPGTHPSLLFSKQEIGALREKAHDTGFPGEMWKKIKQYARDWPLVEDPYAGPNKIGMEIDAKALIYEVEGNKKVGLKALKKLKEVLDTLDPHRYYFEEGRTNVFWTDKWPKTFAYAYDWLYPLMTQSERTKIAHQLRKWCKALYTHTQEHWWRDAYINVGAIPVGALGLLCIAIKGEEGGDPEFDKWLNSSMKSIRDNYFPYAWRQNGICTEGPDYAQYCKNPLMFGEAWRRNGGTDIVTQSGAINAMRYQRFQWKPGGGEAPIGDNTTYGRRVFQPIYLLGISHNQDKAGLYTFLKWVDPKEINPIFAFIFYPHNLKPESAAEQKLPTSHYFEITSNRAGYFFSRSEWGNKDAAFFAFVTRYEDANHQHYDMNSFLFSAFGEDFATHKLLHPYHDSLHGIDKEHNLVIIDGGGMPGHDAIDGAGDDCSLNGYMTGVGTGHFADYVRGAAAESYKDRSLKRSKPAVLAHRAVAFVKQGPNPYIIIADDIQKSKKGDHLYEWLLHSNVSKLGGGNGTLKAPLIIPGKNANCAVSFVTPAHPKYSFNIVHGNDNYHKTALGCIDIRQRGNRVKYFAIAAAWKKNHSRPIFKRGPNPLGNAEAYSLIVKGNGYTDHIIWQPQQETGQPGVKITVDSISTNALITVVRVNDKTGEIMGYLMGDGTTLSYKGKRLVEGKTPLTVSADTVSLIATGKRRPYKGLAALSVRGRIWLPKKHIRIRANDVILKPKITKDQVAIIH